MTPPIKQSESAVQVLEVGYEYVTLDLPGDVHDAPRAIPQDLIEFGEEARNWFTWDMRDKTPRNPATTAGYAGRVAWGRDNVSWDDRAGSRFSDVLDALAGSVDGHREQSWTWRTDDGVTEDPRDLYPTVVVPHADFQPDDPLMLVDLDDVIEPQGDSTGVMTREAWDIIKELDAYAEVSTSRTGVHVFVKARLPAWLDGSKVIENLTQELPSGETPQIEVYGYPADGRVVGCTWMHIDETPRHAVPDRQGVIDTALVEYISDDDQLTPAEQARQAYEDATGDANINDNAGGSRSAYYSIDVKQVAHTGAFRAHGSNGRGPHPVHGGTSSKDEESTNFAVSRRNGWTCWAHDDGGGALQLIAVIEDIRDCGNASDVMDDPVDALRVCLAARDEHASDLGDETPPTQALCGVLEVQGMDYSEGGRLSRANYRCAQSLYEDMEYTG